jgi:hypothetical protein
MFEVHAEAISSMLDTTIIPPDANCIMRARQLRDRLDALIASAEAEFDATEGWREHGFGSLSSWLQHEAATTRLEASFASRRAVRLHAWPEVATAWRSGHLSGAKVDELIRAIPTRFVRSFIPDQELVIDTISPLSAAESARVVHHWVTLAEAADECFADRPSGLHLSTTTGGRGVLDADLDAESTAVLMAALRVFERPEPGGLDAEDRRAVAESLDPPRTPAQVRAEALIALARFGLAHHRSGSNIARHQPHVSLIIDLPELLAATLRGSGVHSATSLEVFAEHHQLSPTEQTWFTAALERAGAGTTADGAALSALALGTLSCDSVLQRVITNGGHILELGRTVRSVPPPLRRAVIARDHHCRAPGCTRPARWCDVHHIDHWVTGGHTDLHRLVLLCSFHHHLFHRPGWQTELDDQAVLTVRAPDGRVRRTEPPSHAPPLTHRRGSPGTRHRIREGLVLQPNKLAAAADP